MDPRLATRLSKFLSLVLRHRPDDFGLQMDDQGFVLVEDIVDVIVAEDILAENVQEILQELVEEADRPRFEIVEGRIRALYGHSSRIRLDYPADEPPPLLFHGTGLQMARRIGDEGIRPAGRAYVHLSATEEEALSVGGRHADDPVLIRIDTGQAREEGVRFNQEAEASSDTAGGGGSGSPAATGAFKRRTRKKKPRR